MKSNTMAKSEAKTWGYAGQVGEWMGSIAIPAAYQQPSRAALLHVLEGLETPIEALHRPRVVVVTWAELDASGAQVALHEADEYPVTDWDTISTVIADLRGGDGSEIIVRGIVVRLETRLTDAAEPWAEGSAELAIVLAPPSAAVATVTYTTFIDVWLSSTYGADYAPLHNRAGAAANRPHLEAFLGELQRLAPTSWHVGYSQLYSAAITSDGFRDFDDLLERYDRY